MRFGSLCVTSILVSLAAPAQADDSRPWTLHAAVGAPDRLKLSGSIRLRQEVLDGQFRPRLDGDDHLLSIRTAIAAEYDLGRVRVGGELIDSRVYLGDDDTPIGTTEVDAVELVQAYAAIDLGDALGTRSDASVMAGRMTLDFGSRRLIANETFRNTSNGFTGLRVDWQRSGQAATLAYLLPQQRFPDDRPSLRHNEVEIDRETTDLRLWAGLYSREIGDGPTVEFYVVGLDERDSADRATRNRRLVTPGARLFRDAKVGTTDYEFEAMRQTGKVRATAAATDLRDLDQRAWFVHAEIGHMFDTVWRTRIALEYDRASGDRASTGPVERFDTYYGSRRNDYGPTSIYGPLGRANISSPAVRLEIAPGKRWDAFAAYRAAWLDQPGDSFASTGVRDPLGRSGSFAGHQLEARGRLWLLPKQLRVEIGAALLNTGRFLDTAPNASGNGDTVYSYMDLTASF